MRPHSTLRTRRERLVSPRQWHGVPDAERKAAEDKSDRDAKSERETGKDGVEDPLGATAGST